MMDSNKYRLSKAALENAYQQVYDFYARNRASLTFPRIAVLSAQSGAGKSSIFSLINSQFEPDKKPVHVDIDETRDFNDRKQEMVDDDPFSLAFYSNEDSWLLTKRLLDDSKTARNNVIYETTLRSVHDIEEIIKGFHSESYAVDLHALAVNSKNSILGIHKRFEGRLAALIPARWTPIEFHDNAYQVFPVNVDYLEKSAGLEVVAVYSREGKILYHNDKNPLNHGAQNAIEQERARIWLPVEKEEYVAEWNRIAKQVEKRPAGKAKPAWYVEGVGGFLKEAELFCMARQATENDVPNAFAIEARTHHHIFARDASTQELICFAHNTPSTPAPRSGSVANKIQPKP